MKESTENKQEVSNKQEVATGDNATETPKPAAKPGKTGKEGKLKETVYKCCGQKAFFDESNIDQCFGNFKDCPLYRVGNQYFSMEKCTHLGEQKNNMPAVDRSVSYAPKVEKKVETEKSMSNPCGLSHHTCCPMPQVSDIFKPTNFSVDRTDVQQTQPIPTQCPQSCSSCGGQTNIDRLIVAANVEKEKCSRNKCANIQSQSSCACPTCPSQDNRKKDCSNHIVSGTDCKCCNFPTQEACDKGDACKSGIIKVVHCGESPNCVNELDTRQDISKCESNKCHEAKCVPHIHVMSSHNATCKPQCETKHCCKPQCETQPCKPQCETQQCKPQCETQQCKPQCETQQCKPQCDTQHCKPQCQTKPCCKPHKETKFMLPADSKCVSQSCTKCMPPSGPKCMPPSGPKCMPPSGPKCMPPSGPKCMPPSGPKCVSQSNPKCVSQSNPKCVSQSSPKRMPQSAPKCISPSGPRGMSHSGPKCVTQNKANCMSNNGTNCIIDKKSSCIRQNICENRSKEAFVVNNEFIIGKENVPMNMRFDHSPIIKNKCAKTKTKNENSQCINRKMELQKFISSSYPHQQICTDKTPFRVGDVQRSLLNSNRYFKVVKSNPYVQSKKYHNYKQPYHIGPKTMIYSKLRSKSRYSSPVPIKVRTVDPTRCPPGESQCCEHRTQKPNPTQCAKGITNQSNSVQRNGSTDDQSDSTEMSQQSSNQSDSLGPQIHYIPLESESNMHQANNCELKNIQCCAQECSEPREQCCAQECSEPREQCCANETKQCNTTPCCKCQCESMDCDESEVHHCDSICESRAEIYVKYDQMDCPESITNECKIIHYYIPVQYYENEIKESKECCKTMKYAEPEMTECAQMKYCEPNLKDCKPVKHSEPRAKKFKQPCEGDLKDHNATHNHQEHCGVTDDPCICDFKNECVDYDSKCNAEKSNVAPLKKRHSEIMSKCLCQDDIKHCPKSAFLPHTYCHLSKDPTDKPSDRSCKGFLRQKPRNTHSPFCRNFEELCKVPQFVCYQKPKLEKDDYSWRFTGTPCTYPAASRHSSLPGREEKKVTTAEEVQHKGEDGKEVKVDVKDPMEKGKEIDDKKPGAADKKPEVVDKEKGVAGKEKGVAGKEKGMGEKGKAAGGKKVQTKGSGGKPQKSNTKAAANQKAKQKGAKSKSTDSKSTKSAKSKASGKHAKQAPPKKKK